MLLNSKQSILDPCPRQRHSIQRILWHHQQEETKSFQLNRSMCSHLYTLGLHLRWKSNSIQRIHRLLRRAFLDLLSGSHPSSFAF